MDIGQAKRHGKIEERKCEQTMQQSYRNLEKINYLQKYRKYDILSVIMKSSSLSTSRKNTFFSLITWMLLSISATILYRYLVIADGWSPSELSTIDTIYGFVRILIYVIIFANIVSFIFSEIEHSFLVDGVVMRRFFPLIRVIAISMIWIIGVFYILDNLRVNTSSILTGA